MSLPLTVIGGGLSGCEAAWQAAERGISTTLYEMRPAVTTPAHTTDYLAELVCSNSLGSSLVDRAPGLLKEELHRLGSLIIDVAGEHQVPAGSALAVDRIGFSRDITRRIQNHRNIRLVREEVESIPLNGLVIVATGPLTSPKLTADITQHTGDDNLYFYDAIAPIVEIESIDMSVAYQASRYDKGQTETGDYINCPFTLQEYHTFVKALLNAERSPLKDFEKDRQHFFEGCLPIEILAERGENALAYGPMRPVGLYNPRTGKRPYAVVQLRQDNAAGSMYNLVGFQTNLKYREQTRVFRMIPGLQQAVFVRYGSMHRNTYINAPNVILPTLQSKKRKELFFCGQIAGLEGYTGNIAGGWLAGYNAARLASGIQAVTLPQETMIGAMMHYIAYAEARYFQPMKANFGLVPSLNERVKGKRARAMKYSTRALESLNAWLTNQTDAYLRSFPQRHG